MHSNLQVKSIPVMWKFPAKTRKEFPVLRHPMFYKVGYERCYVGKTPCVLLGQR